MGVGPSSLRERGSAPTVSFHNFKSQNFKLSVSNPKNKHVAYLSVLSQISNCQSLGRKNKHEILKTDRKRGRHSTIVFPPSASVQWQPDGLTIHTKEVVPRSQIPRSASHFS